MWPCALAVKVCRTPYPLLLFLSLLQLCRHFRDRRAVERRFRLLQCVVQLRTPGDFHEILDLSLGVMKKCIFVGSKQRVKGRGKEEKKDDVSST